MARLIVRNIGPIKDVELDLKKVNVFMGPQGCGKSTLAKIISFCSWLEKDSDATLKAEAKGLVPLLTKYHRMEGYFRADSELAYIGDDVAFFYHFPDPLPLGWNSEENEDVFKREKRSTVSNCECMLLSDKSSRKGWLLLAELKYRGGYGQ